LPTAVVFFVISKSRLQEITSGVFY